MYEFQLLSLFINENATTTTTTDMSADKSKKDLHSTAAQSGSSTGKANGTCSFPTINDPYRALAAHVVVVPGRRSVAGRRRRRAACEIEDGSTDHGTSSFCSRKEINGIMTAAWVDDELWLSVDCF